MADKSDFRSIAALMGDALAQVSKLLQNEIDLAKAELGEKAQQVGVAAGFLVGAAVLVVPALIMVLLALSAALIQGGWSEPAAHLIAALVAMVLAAGLAVVGIQRLKPGNLMPTETMHQLERDKAAMKGMVR